LHSLNGRKSATFCEVSVGQPLVRTSSTSFQISLRSLLSISNAAQVEIGGTLGLTRWRPGPRLDDLADYAAAIYLSQPLIDALSVEDVQAAQRADRLAHFKLHLTNRALVHLFSFLSDASSVTSGATFAVLGL